MRSFNFPVELNISCDLTGGSVVLQHNLQMFLPKVREGSSPGSKKFKKYRLYYVQTLFRIYLRTPFKHRVKIKFQSSYFKLGKNRKNY